MADESVDSAAELMRKTRLDAKRAATPITVAYHITNVLETADRPTWPALRWTLNSDNLYAKKLIGHPTLWFSTTLYNNELPNLTVYPNGGENGNFYHRVAIPMTTFDKFNIVFLSQQEKQIQLLLWETEDIPDETIKHILAVETLEELKEKAKEYLRKEQRTKKTEWFSNDYNVEKYFVNFVVLRDIELKEAQWDTVERQVTVDESRRYHISNIRQRLITHLSEKPMKVN